MILADSKIKERILNGSIGFESMGDYNVMEQIGPASIDFRLGNTFKIYRRSRKTCIDTREGVDPEHVETIILKDSESFVIHPGDFVLGVTLEKIKVPYDLVCRCEGRSSLGRLGLIIHSTAGFVDPGFEGTITLEITNINVLPVRVYTGMRFGQFAFETIEGKVDIPYDVRKGSKYMHQVVAEESKINTDIN